MVNYDIDQLKILLHSFYLILNIRIVVFDDKFEKIAEVPDHECKFCSLLLGDPIAEKECRAADRHAFMRCRDTNTPYSYKCHAGLTETVAPIQYNNIIIGYLMFGQVLQQTDAGAYWEEVKTRCEKYDVNIEDLYSAYREKQPITQEQVNAAAQLLEACAAYLWLKNYISLKEGNVLIRIDEYITDNLNADLSVSVLCEKFKISRSKLYRIAKKYYATDIEKLIRRLRVNKAKALLENTDLPVSEIALQSGYADYNYFIKVFKNIVNLTPVQYRKKYKRAQR